MIDLGRRTAWIHTSSAHLAVWHAVSFALVLLLPAMSWLGRPVWAMPAAEQTQVWVWGAIYLVFVTILRLTAGRDKVTSLVMTALAIVACWGGGYAVLALGLGVPVSRGVAVLAVALGLSFGIAPLIFSRRLVIAAAALVMGLLIMMPWRGVEATRRTITNESIHVPSSRYLLTIDIHPSVAPRIMNGGAIAALGDGFLVATAHGTFHSVRWLEGGRQLRSYPLNIDAPLNREDFLADLGRPKDPPFFRVTDLLFGPGGGAPRLYVAHQYWNPAQRCLTMRVSVATLDTTAWTASPWERVYETRPCLSMTHGFLHDETGGRMAWRGDRLLFTVGDHGYGLGRGLAQDTASDYGKILELDLRGGRRLVSLGHRNPQGLLVASDGRIWSTEHGPQGGDEINLITRGGNYGWPLRTYGTMYGLRSWPADSSVGSHEGFVEPAYAFVPSVGPSAIIEVTGGALSAWRGDLLVGSLTGRSLFRVRVRDGRVVFTERIDVRRRVRDIAQTPDGRVVLLTDEGNVLVLSEAADLPAGEVAYASCAACHGADLRGTSAGPSLRSLIGRGVAALGDFAYSSALKGAGGQWTRVRLDEFLRDPAAFAPGTSMRVEGIGSEETRRALIDFLSNNY